MEEETVMIKEIIFLAQVAFMCFEAYMEMNRHSISPFYITFISDLPSL